MHMGPGVYGTQTQLEALVSLSSHASTAPAASTRGIPRPLRFFTHRPHFFYTTNPMTDLGKKSHDVWELFSVPPALARFAVFEAHEQLAGPAGRVIPGHGA